MTIQWLIDRMQQHVGKEAMVWNDQSFRYEEILEGYRDSRQQLAGFGIEPGEVIALAGDYSPQACGMLLALMANGNMLVPLSSSIMNKKAELLEIANVSRLLNWDGNAFQPEILNHELKHEMLLRMKHNNQPGIILFSSGTTGVPKGIVHDLTKFLEKFKSQRETLRTLTFLLFDHIGGLNTLFHTLSNGGTVICPKSRTPREICYAIEQYKVELLPTSPSFLNLLLMTHEHQHHDMSSLKLITYGTEVMYEHTLSALRKDLPEVQFRQTYGLSELGILRSKSQDSDSLWVRIGGDSYQTKVIDHILYIKSDMAMEGYLNAPNPFDAEGWFNTQDQVEVEGEYIRILGRKSEIINVGGQKVYPAEIEEVLLQIPEIKDVAVKGEPNILLGNVVIAIVNLTRPMEQKEVKSIIRNYCRTRLEAYQVPVKVVIQEAELYSDRYKKMRK